MIGIFVTGGSSLLAMMLLGGLLGNKTCLCRYSPFFVVLITLLTYLFLRKDHTCTKKTKQIGWIRKRINYSVQKICMSKKNSNAMLVSISLCQ